MTEKLIDSAYRCGRASARPRVFKGEEHTGRWFWKMTREWAVAVVLDEEGGVLAFAGDGSKLDSIGDASRAQKDACRTFRTCG